MPQVRNGAQLVKLLQESRTGAEKIKVLADEVRRVHDTTGRVLTSAEVVAFMEDDSRFSIDTVKKAKLIAETGSWVEDVVVEEDPTAVLDELKNLPVAEPKRRPAPAPNVPSSVPNLDDLAATFGAPAGPVVGQGEVDAAIKTAETTPEPAPPAVSDPVEAAFQVNKGDKVGRRK